MKTTEMPSLEYIEIPRGKSSPIKLDVLLQKRMRDFLWTRQARLIGFPEQATVNPTIEINEKVDIVPIFRANADALHVCMPWKMRYHGQEIEFTRLGMRHPTEKGKRMIHVFEMGDDNGNDYRLEFDAERLMWVLVSMIGGM